MRKCIGTLWGGLFSALLILQGASFAATPDDNDADPNLPPHDTVCKGGFVSRKQLAYQLLVNIKNTRAVVRISSGPELWHTIYTDDNFCPIKSKGACKDPKSSGCKAAKNCESDQLDAINSGVAFFAAVNANLRKPVPSYLPAQGLRDLHKGSDPFSGASDQLALFFSAGSAYNDADKANSISCTATEAPQPPPPFDPSGDTSPLSKLRVRGLSDDLYISRLEGNFKATTPATATITSTTTGTPAATTVTTKASAALGYAFDAIPQTQIVPYFSFSQSVTDAQGKPIVNDATNNVALGVVAERYFISPDNPEISHVFSIKPQFLLNTTDQSEVASARLIYAPWIDSANFNLNTFRKLDFLPGSTWGEFVFDVRNDSGAYTNRGDTPAIVATNKDFDRAGTRFGIALATDNFPSLTLLVNETYLYGFTGYYRSLGMFQASLTYNIVNSYLGLTASYKRGRDEDTAVSSQTWTVGLTARY